MDYLYGQNNRQISGIQFYQRSGTQHFWRMESKPGSGHSIFRVEKKGDRWWIVDPDGYPFIHKGVAVFRPGTSSEQKAAMNS